MDEQIDEYNFREAGIDDVAGLHAVRISVKENILNNPALASESDYINYLTNRGKGWLCEIESDIIAFAIIDTERNNIWALFVRPECEKKGVGKRLHNIMLDWFFDQSEKNIWLGTAPGTRAEKFYKLCGWKEVGLRDNGEIKLEMTAAKWKQICGT